jgi:hypothetical protein
LWSLHRAARASQEPYIFVIDGLHEFSATENITRQTVTSLLHFDSAWFRYVISASPGELPVQLPNDIQVNRIGVAVMGRDEVQDLFQPFGVAAPDLETIRRVTRGIPLKLVTIRRLLEGGAPLSEVLSDVPETDSNFFSAEWKSIEPIADDTDRLLLALICFDPRTPTVLELSRAVGCSPTELLERIAKFSFLQVEAARQTVQFEAEAFRRFASGKLEDYSDRAYEALISEFTSDPSTDTGLTVLPELYAKAHRPQELLAFLSVERLGRMLDLEYSYSVLRQRSELGMRAASDLARDEEVLRFGLHRSCIAAVERQPTSAALVAALIALRDYDSAVFHAQNSGRKEDRLHLLSTIVSAKRRQSALGDPGLDQEIRSLANEIDVKALGARAVEIAAELIFTNPAMALELVERAGGDRNRRDMDWALARLAVTWSTATDNEREHADGVEKSIRERIGSPEVRRFTERIAGAVRKLSAEQALAEVERYGEPLERLYFLRNWLAHNWDSPRAALVSEFTLGLAVQASAFSISPSFLRDVAAPLRHSTNIDLLKRLVHLIDGLTQTIEVRSRVTEILDVRISLAEAEVQYSPDDGGERLVEAYFAAVDIQSVTERCEALASLLSAATRVASAYPAIEERHSIVELAAAHLHDSVDLMLRELADHYRAARGTIARLMPDVRAEAEVVASKLNTRARRELAMSDIAHSLAAVTQSRDWSFVLDVCERLETPAIRDRLVSTIAERLRDEERHGLTRSQFHRLLRQIERLLDARDRFLALCSMYTAARRSSDDGVQNHIGALADRVVQCWAEIERSWDRVEAGYEGVALLAAVSDGLGDTLLKDVGTFQNALSISTAAAADAYIAAVRLAIRSFAGLLAQGLDTVGSERVLETLITRIPSPGDQAVLWAEVAMQYLRHRMSDNARDIVIQRVRPACDSLNVADPSGRFEILSEVLPVLFVVSRTTTVELLRALPSAYRDAGIQIVVDYLLTGRTVAEPYDYIKGRAHESSFDELVEAAELLSMAEHDALIWSRCHRIADNALATRTRVLTAEQRADLADRLRRGARAKLPVAHGITHDGPAIVADTHIARLSRVRPEVWQDLRDRAAAIPNTADRALVLFALADALPQNERIGRGTIVRQAFNEIDSMSSSADKIDRFTQFAEEMWFRSEDLCKQALKRAVEVAHDTAAQPGYSAVRTILDVAYRYDEQLAHTLAKELDDDPGRRAARLAAADQMKLLDMKKRIGSGIARDAADPEFAQRYAESATLALGALNAGHKRPAGLTALREAAPIAAMLPVDESLPIYNWIVENIVRSPQRDDSMRTSVSGLFQAAIKSADLTFRLVASNATVRRAAAERFERDVSSSITVGPGERDRVFEFIRNWWSERQADEVIIQDPYFGPEDLEVVELLAWVSPGSRFTVITSRAHQLALGVEQPYRNAYAQHWKRLTDRDPPAVDITVVGVEPTGESPIHDRWIIAGERGLVLGTSTNSIGRTRLSQIRTLEPSEVAEIDARLQPIVLRSLRARGASRISYDVFTL